MKSRSLDLTIRLRAILILFVMLYHSLSIYVLPNFPYKTTAQLPEAIFNPTTISIIYSMFPIMGIFFILSGYSFVYTLKKSTDYSILMKKKIKRLIIPFLFVGTCYVLPIKYFLRHPEFRSLSSLRIVYKFFITGSLAGHLWFLPVLFLMFVVYGIGYHFYGLTKKADIISIAVSVLLLFVFLVVPVGTAFSRYFATNFLFFVLGLLIHRHQVYLIKMFRDKGKVAIFIVFVIVIIPAGILLGGLLRSYSLSLLFAPFALGFFYIIPLRTNYFLKLIGNHSMQLYLLHSPMTYFSYTFWPNLNPILMFLVNFFVFGMFALGISLFFQKVGLNWLLGER